MRHRGWIRPVGNERNCHLFFSTHCVTPGCFMSLPSCLVLALYSPSPPFFLSESVLHLQLCTLPLPSPFTPFSLTPLLCPPFFLFFSLRLKRMHYFQPRLCGVDRESRTMAAFQSHDPALGGALAVSIFLYCQFKQANAASLLLARLATTVD